MGLKLIKDNGKVRKTWYGQYMENGVWRVTKLTTPMRGQLIPSRLSEKGDDAFERSRALAQAEFDHFEEERKVKGCTEHLTRALIESKTGQKIENVRVDELESKWRQSHIRNRSENWNKSITWLFKTFTETITCTYLYDPRWCQHSTTPFASNMRGLQSRG